MRRGTRGVHGLWTAGASRGRVGGVSFPFSPFPGWSGGGGVSYICSPFFVGGRGGGVGSLRGGGGEGGGEVRLGFFLFIWGAVAWGLRVAIRSVAA